MTDIEKVIAGLMMLVDRKNDDTCEGLKCCKIAEDALALLKDREPVSPIDENDWNHTLGRCGHCKAPLPAIEGLRSKFCWMCGRAVKWE